MKWRKNVEWNGGVKVAWKRVMKSGAKKWCGNVKSKYGVKENPAFFILYGGLIIVLIEWSLSLNQFSLVGYIYS